MTQLIQTADGSPTLYVPALDEHYHSTHGAVQEAEHVYIRAGLAEVLQPLRPTARVLELGFGTGLNALLTWEYLRAHAPNTRLEYETVEKYPLDQALADAYLSALPADAERQAAFRALHTTPWETPTALDPQFTLFKRQGSFEALNFLASSYDVIYFDAFAPQKQPELWTDEILIRTGNLLGAGAVIVTYCARGALKRAWRAAGLEVETLPGAPGKREMVRARRS